MTSFVVGQRVTSEAKKVASEEENAFDRGTVKYVGEVDGTQVS